MGWSEDEIEFGLRGEPFFELSPYYYCTFTAYGKKWRTLIHFWCSMYFKDDYTREYIRNQGTPQVAYNCAKAKGFKDFNSIDVETFIYGLQERFNQNDQLRMVLLSTGSANLKFQGSKGYLSENNRYGKLLMRIREMYQE